MVGGGNNLEMASAVGKGRKSPRKKMKLPSTFFGLTPFATPTTPPPITTPSTTATAITKKLLHLF